MKHVHSNKLFFYFNISAIDITISSLQHELVIFCIGQICLDNSNHHFSWLHHGFSLNKHL